MRVAKHTSTAHHGRVTLGRGRRSACMIAPSVCTLPGGSNLLPPPTYALTSPEPYACMDAYTRSPSRASYLHGLPGLRRSSSRRLARSCATANGHPSTPRYLPSLIWGVRPPPIHSPLSAKSSISAFRRELARACVPLTTHPALLRPTSSAPSHKQVAECRHKLREQLRRADRLWPSSEGMDARRLGHKLRGSFVASFSPMVVGTARLRALKCCGPSNADVEVELGLPTQRRRLGSA